MKLLHETCPVSQNLQYPVGRCLTELGHLTDRGIGFNVKHSLVLTIINEQHGGTHLWPNNLEFQTWVFLCFTCDSYEIIWMGSSWEQGQKPEHIVVSLFLGYCLSLSTKARLPLACSPGLPLLPVQ